MLQTISFRPEIKNLEFLSNVPNSKKSKIINEALKYHRLYLLRKNLRDWFLSQSKDDLDLANLWFEDYLSIIDKN